MSQVAERETVIKKYLLGELPEDQAAEVEIRVLTDAEYFDELVLVEGELTDDFMFGVLSDDEEERIRTHFLAAPERRERLSLTRVIEQYISKYTIDRSFDQKLEDSLCEAQELRKRFWALISDDWIGLQLLALLRSSSQPGSELCSKVNALDSVVTFSVNRLIECGLVNNMAGILVCTGLGTETLEDMERSCGLRLGP